MKPGSGSEAELKLGPGRVVADLHDLPCRADILELLPFAWWGIGEDRMSYVANSSRTVRRKGGVGPVRVAGEYLRKLRPLLSSYLFLYI